MKAQRANSESPISALSERAGKRYRLGAAIVQLEGAVMPKPVTIQPRK